MTRLHNQLQELRAFLPRCGFKEDTFGHFQRTIVTTNVLTKESREVLVRIKIQTTNVRVETKRPNVPGATWFRNCSAYLKDIKYADEWVRIGRFKFRVEPK